nr:type II toxin-antitoxin system PemK/MazF family toxin [uncultured Rhodopila sp.]
MAIPRHIRLAPGQIVMVEFGPDPRQVAAPGIMTGPLGVLPEMYKLRHCIVVSTTIGLTTIVPLSSKPPPHPRPLHFRLPAGKYPGTSVTEDSWTKSDLLTTVSNDRVDRVLVAGRRTTVLLDAGDLKAVRAAVLHALQLGRLTSGL